jgi:chemotaxis protein histidine kinase CheA
MHTVKGMAGTLGAMPLSRLAGEAEARLRGGSPVRDPSVQAVTEAIEATLGELGETG